MAASLEWDGAPEFSQALVDRMEAARRAARTFVVQGLHLGQEAIQVRAREGGRHAPGTPTPATKGGGPAVIHGDLGRSIVVGDLRSTGVLGYEGRVGPTTVYGRAVELKYGYPYTGPGWRDTVPRLGALARSIYGSAVRLGKG